MQLQKNFPNFPQKSSIRCTALLSISMMCSPSTNKARLSPLVQHHRYPHYDIPSHQEVWQFCGQKKCDSLQAQAFCLSQMYLEFPTALIYRSWDI